METVQQEGTRRVTRSREPFNLDAVISVGYRVNSTQATQFRIWATRTLREHLVRGYTLNERRLREQGLGAIEQTFGGEPLYPTVQACAAHVLYFVIKDHPFSDGNKRTGTLLFLEYLRLNRLLLSLLEDDSG